VRLAGDQALRVGLERDVVHSRKAPDRGALARELDRDRFGTVDSRDDDLRRSSHERNSIDRPSRIHGSASFPRSHSLQ
jgi:hypothetical protein